MTNGNRERSLRGATVGVTRTESRQRWWVHIPIEPLPYGKSSWSRSLCTLRCARTKRRPSTCAKSTMRVQNTGKDRSGKPTWQPSGKRISVDHALCRSSTASLDVRLLTCEPGRHERPRVYRAVSPIRVDRDRACPGEVKFPLACVPALRNCRGSDLCERFVFDSASV